MDISNIFSGAIWPLKIHSSHLIIHCILLVTRKKETEGLVPWPHSYVGLSVTKCSVIHHQEMINYNEIQFHFVLNHAFYENPVKFYHQPQKAIVKPYDTLCFTFLGAFNKENYWFWVVWSTLYKKLPSVHSFLFTRLKVGENRRSHRNAHERKFCGVLS